MEQTTFTTENNQSTNINAGVEKNTANAAVELFDGEELIFSVINNHSAALNAQITDYSVENNFAIHDHIAFAPIVVTLSGLASNLVLKSEEAIQQAQDELEQAKNRQRLSGNFFYLPNYITEGASSSMVTTKLGTIGSLFPLMSNITQMAVNAIEYAYEAAGALLINKWMNKNDAVLDNKLIKSGEQTELQRIYEQIKNTFYGRKPNVVYTPWAVYENMYIQGIDVSQDELNHIVDLSITFKQLNFAQVEYGKANEQVLASYFAPCRAEEQDCGKNRSMLLELGESGNNVIKQGIKGLKDIF